MFKEEKTIEELLEDNASFKVYDEDQERLLKKAYAVAEKAHKGQTRDDGTPYFEHPKRVAELAKKYYGTSLSESMMIIALLHDVLEDTDVSYEYLEEQFDFLVESISLLTRQKEESYETYIERVFKDGAPINIPIKLLDKMDNIMDLKNCPDRDKVKRYIKETENVFLPIAENHKFTETDAKYKRILDDLTKEVKYIKSNI